MQDPGSDPTKTATPGDRRPAGRILGILALAALYLLGLVHWDYFFDHGNILFTSRDWPKEALYYTLLRDTIRTGTLPFHIDVQTSPPAELTHGTNRFLALPETNLSPQILLLPWLDTGPFIVVNVCILYTAGFIGCLLLKRRYRLSLVPFAFLWLLFNFNGSPTAHLAAGHSMWVGHFLLPFFFLFLLELIEEPAPTRPALKLSATFFAMFLQGSFHFVVWCSLFLLLFVVFNRRFLKPVLLALVVAMLLSLFRILPAAIAFWGDKQHEFLAGYPTIGDLLHSFITIRPYFYRGIGRVYYFKGLVWCEYDLYMSMPGFVLFVIFGIFLRFSRDPAFASCRYREFDKPIILQAILSFSDVFAFVALLPIPLFNGERVSARFMIIPVTLLIILGAIRMQRLLDSVEEGRRWLVKTALGGVVVVSAFFIALHTQAWGAAALNAEWDEPPGEVSVTVVEQPDLIYRAALVVALVVTAAAWLAWLYWYRHPNAAERTCGAVERMVVRLPIVRDLVSARAKAKTELITSPEKETGTQI
jgi:hypothetical protein